MKIIQNVKSQLSPRQLHALIEATRLINSTLDLDELLFIIVEEINRNLQADRTTLYLVDEERRMIWSKILLGDEALEIRQPIGKGLSGYVAQTGEILNIRDAYEDGRFNPEVDVKSGYRTRSVICVPVFDKNGRIIGVIQSLNKKDGFFNKKDEQFLMALADHIAIAIQNAQLYQEALARKHLEDEISLAAEIQKHLLPQDNWEIPGYEIFAFQQPSKQVGGDYYDFFHYPPNLSFIIADVSGKGIPAALLMANLHAACHALFFEKIDCIDLAKKINHHFNVFTASDKYATLFLGELQYTQHLLKYVNCGHVPPILFRPSRAKDPFLFLEKGGIPVGMLDDFDYEEKKVHLLAGDLVMICSDGITEAMTSRGQMFGMNRIKNFLRQNHHLSITEMGQRLLKKVFRFSKKGMYHDDITLVILKRT